MYYSKGAPAGLTGQCHCARLHILVPNLPGSLGAEYFHLLAVCKWYIHGLINCSAPHGQCERLYQLAGCKHNSNLDLNVEKSINFSVAKPTLKLVQ